MTQNPFDALGAGGFDMNALLQQAQQLQEQLASAQDRLAETTVEGQVGGGVVTVTLSGTGELKAVTIKPGTVDGDDEESLDELGDLIVAAYRDAKTKADELVGESMNPFGQTGLTGPGRRRRGVRGRSARPPARTGLASTLYEGVVQDLIDELGRLPGVGPKSAQRIAFHLLQADPVDVRRLADVLVRGQGEGPVLRGLRQRRRGGPVPDLPRSAPRPDGDLRRRGVQGRRRDRADPRVPGPLPRARRGDLARSRASAPTSCGSAS